ncbi:MAG TPA: hypothetical protein VHZ51_08820 [Ktedonobacteraceae bacterium]|nr:hypothetical protein [Ktedonobacteraceae bacterium]
MPTVPPAFGKLTAAQQALAESLQVPQELLVAAVRHSQAAMPSSSDDFAKWVELLPQERRNDYLVKLAQNKPGLSHLLARELRTLGGSKTKAAAGAGERVTYATLLAESKAISTERARKKYEQEQLARQQHLQGIHDHQDTYWQQVDLAATRRTAAGYNEAVQLLIDLRAAADQFKESQEFQERFQAWVQPYLRRPALINRLRDHRFTTS